MSPEWLRNLGARRHSGGLSRILSLESPIPRLGYNPAIPFAPGRMSQRLLIRLQTSGRHTWLAPGASAATAGLPTAQALARAQQVVVLVPATEVVLLEAPAVSRNR